MVIERQEKKAAPRTTTATTPRRWRGFQSKWIWSTTDSTMMTTTWENERTPAAKALPLIRASLGVGVAISLVRIPESRSQMIWMPKKMAMKRADWAMIPGER